MYYGGDLERPVVLPEYKEIGVPIIMDIIDTAGISRDQFFKILKDC